RFSRGGARRRSGANCSTSLASRTRRSYSSPPWPLSQPSRLWYQRLLRSTSLTEIRGWGHIAGAESRDVRGWGGPWPLCRQLCQREPAPLAPSRHHSDLLGQFEVHASNSEMPAADGAARVRRVREGSRNRTPWRLSVLDSTSH